MEILQFQGIDLNGEILLNTGGTLNSAGKKKYDISVGLSNIMNYIRGWVPEPTYLTQKNMIDLKEFGVKFYCLGPSREMHMLGGQSHMNNAPGQSMSLNQTNAFLAAAVKYIGNNLSSNINNLPDVDVDELFEQSQPFGREKMLKLSDIKQCCQPDNSTICSTDVQEAAKYLEQVYGFGDEESEYCPKWRRIDTDWLLMGEMLALQQVSIVNNTSLVLAIELTESGKVLLFCGDAEEENWQTWKNDQAEIKDLLARTVVYKTGHHGSINATDRAMLKDQMTSKDLVALIPVDVAVAHSKKSKTNPDGWQFPDPLLYNLEATSEADKGLLYTQTGGRIILNCIDKCTNCGAEYDRNKSWPGEIVDTEPNKLWVDYVLHL